MENCSNCGGRLSAELEWCPQCFEKVPSAVPEPAAPRAQATPQAPATDPAQPIARSMAQAPASAPTALLSPTPAGWREDALVEDPDIAALRAQQPTIPGRGLLAKRVSITVLLFFGAELGSGAIHGATGNAFLGLMAVAAIPILWFTWFRLR